MNEVMNALLERRSIRKYTDAPVSEAELSAILEAGLWAPTARNRQEVKFSVVTDPALRAAFREAFEAYDTRGFRTFDYEAPVLILLYGAQDFPYTELDSGIAVESMATAAQSFGLGTLIVGCIRDFLRSEEGKPWREKFGIAETELFTIGLCIGHTAAPTKKQDRKPDRVQYFA